MCLPVVKIESVSTETRESIGCVRIAQYEDGSVLELYADGRWAFGVDGMVDARGKGDFALDGYESPKATK